MKRIILLSTDTLHHRFFIKKIDQSVSNVIKYIFETTSINFKFKTGPTFEKKQKKFENKLFFNKSDSALDNNKIKKFNNINSNESFSYLKKIKPDIGLVFGTRKIDQRIINIFKDGLINAHRGNPEEYRGLDSDLWAMYHGEYEKIYSTIHYVNPSLDTGDIIYRKKLKIDKHTRAHKVQGLTTIVTTDLFIKFLNDYHSKKIITRKQKKIGRYYSKIPYDLKKISIKKFDNYCKKK